MTHLYTSRLVPWLLCALMGAFGKRHRVLPTPLLRPAFNPALAPRVGQRAGHAWTAGRPSAHVGGAGVGPMRSSLVGPSVQSPMEQYVLHARSDDKRETGVLPSFGEGADFETAKAFAKTRTFYVAPWGDDVTPKPIYAVSDNSSILATRLALCAFRQFGSSSRAIIEKKSNVMSEEAIAEVVDEAAQQGTGAMVVYTVASRELGASLAAESKKRGVPYLNAMEPVLTSMENLFGLDREVHQDDADSFHWGSYKRDLTVFAVSDSTGTSARAMVAAASRQFPDMSIDSVTTCDYVSSLEEINHIVEEALAQETMIVFTFANPGMGRYMRQQCERAKVPYADVFQPIVVAMETYLKYPPVGVAGGHDLKEISMPRVHWKRSPVDSIHFSDDSNDFEADF